MKFNTPYNLSESHAHLQAVEDFGTTRTSQDGADDADINVIVARFTQGGAMPGASAVPQYGDFVGLPQLPEALMIVRDAQEKFNMLPSGVRERFANSPVKFAEFATQESNFDELVKLGLAKPKEVVKEPEPMRVRVVPD